MRNDATNVHNQSRIHGSLIAILWANEAKKMKRELVTQDGPHIPQCLMYHDSEHTIGYNGLLIYEQLFRFTFLPWSLVIGHSLTLSQISHVIDDRKLWQ